MGLISKAISTPFFAANDPAERGLTAIMMPARMTTLGVGMATLLPAAASLGTTMLSASNRAKAGRISYAPSMAKMVGGTNTGAVEAMKRASGGNYGVFADMAEGVVSSSGFAKIIDDYGANPAMISALYNMSGR